ncbi:MAG: hypothetical protein ACI9E1_000129, partial [Cryomorphaceae bacterium]
MEYTDEPVVTSFLPRILDPPPSPLSVLEDHAVFAQT